MATDVTRGVAWQVGALTSVDVKDLEDGLSALVLPEDRRSLAAHSETYGLCLDRRETSRSSRASKPRRPN